jgi:hypothetical protein
MLRRATDFKILWLLVFAIALASWARSQRAGQAQTLVVAEFNPIKKGVGDYTELYAYRFRGGVLESRRLSWGGPMHCKGNIHYSIRFDLGHNFIHANRYAVSGTGNVIDLRTGRVLTDFGDELITAVG